MDVLRNNEKELSGVEQLRALVKAGVRPPIMEVMDFELVEIEDGRVVFAGNPAQKYYNPIGSVHGGYAATMLDSACGSAVHTKLGEKQGYTTLEFKIAFHRPLTAETGVVRAEGTVLSMGRRAAFAEAKLIDEQGRLCASATSSLLIIDLG